uniref:Uncharacterized protein n=1 Tax=Arundo donax TaxID=35708 RepID=A0A0A9ABC3_ARUDO
MSLSLLLHLGIPWYHR